MSYSFKDLVNYVMAGHGVMQADMVLDKELRVLYLDSQARESELSMALNVS